VTLTAEAPAGAPFRHDGPAPLVRARELSYLAGGRLLVRGVSLDVAGGEVVGLVGPNGAGKTTLLRLLGGLLQPTTGRMEWPGGAAIGFMGHDTYLYGHLTARENLLYYAVLRGVPPARRRDEVRSGLARVGLAAVADAPVRSFSRGMAQRVALARALLGDPSVLLFDEPESGLDRNARGLLADVLAEARGRGRAVVWSGHDVAFVIAASDRAVLLDRGRAIRRGPGGAEAVDGFVAAFPSGAGIQPARAMWEG
jgi:ABC-type multidrug transport system ATPase subunit